LIDGSGHCGSSQQDRPASGIRALQRIGLKMEHSALRGRSILVVEDEVLIAMDIVQALERAGANATMTTTVRHALILIEHDGLSGAIMDHALSDGDSTKLCARLKARGIPYLSYSGYEPVQGASKDAPHIMKPVSMDVLMSAMEGLLAGPPRVS
jgi:DNA-binding response OmpR family regulator